MNYLLINHIGSMNLLQFYFINAQNTYIASSIFVTLIFYSHIDEMKAKQRPEKF